MWQICKLWKHFKKKYSCFDEHLLRFWGESGETVCKTFRSPNSCHRYGGSKKDRKKGGIHRKHLAFLFSSRPREMLPKRETVGGRTATDTGPRASFLYKKYKKWIILSPQAWHFRWIPVFVMRRLKCRMVLARFTVSTRSSRSCRSTRRSSSATAWRAWSCSRRRSPSSAYPYVCSNSELERICSNF